MSARDEALALVLDAAREQEQRMGDLHHSWSRNLRGDDDERRRFTEFGQRRRDLRDAINVVAAILREEDELAREHAAERAEVAA